MSESAVTGQRKQIRIPKLLKQMGFNRKSLLEFAKLFGLTTFQQRPSIESGESVQTASGNS
jgi:hypothetical protein